MMKAALFTGAGRIELTDLPDPAPGEGEVLLKVLGCGVCGTDAHIYTGDIENAAPPVVLGHEIFGEVVELGGGVSDLSVGDRIAVDPFIFCGFCDFCRESEYRFCLNEQFIGYHRTGGFAEFTTAPSTNCYTLPQDIDLEHGVMVEPLSTVIAGMNRLRPEPGRSALILGAGTIGLLWNQLLKHSLPISLIQTELVPGRLSRVERLGVDAAVQPEEESLADVVHGLCPHGVDYVIDASGSTRAIEEALPLLKRGGTFLSFGICPAEERLSLSLNWFYQRQATFITSRRPPREMKSAIELLSRGVIDTAEIVTGVYPLSGTEAAFHRFFDGREGEAKMAIDPRLE